VTYPATDGVLGLSLSARTERGYVIAALSGELDIASAPALREQLLGLLTPAASRLIIDLSAVSYADASGLTVLVGTARRAGLLGGYLRPAAPSPEVARVLSLTGLDQHLDIFPTVDAAITSPPRSEHPHDARAGERTRSTARAQPAATHTGPRRHAAYDRNSAWQSPRCCCTPTPGATPTPAASSPPPCMTWPRPMPAPAGPP
jgi:anti-anti-sigma factor